MATSSALPLSQRERERIRARHLADQAAAARHQHSGSGTAHSVHRGAVVVAYLLVLTFLLGGGYSVAAALGVVPAVAGSALAGLP